MRNPVYSLMMSLIDILFRKLFIIIVDSFKLILKLLDYLSLFIKAYYFYFKIKLKLLNELLSLSK
jgi:hypothetical protein